MIYWILAYAVVAALAYGFFTYLDEACETNSPGGVLVLSLFWPIFPLLAIGYSFAKLLDRGTEAE